MATAGWGVVVPEEIYRDAGTGDACKRVQHQVFVVQVFVVQVFVVQVFLIRCSSSGACRQLGGVPSSSRRARCA
jgi:hypothetical protein